MKRIHQREDLFAFAARYLLATDSCEDEAFGVANSLSTLKSRIKRRRAAVDMIRVDGFKSVEYMICLLQRLRALRGGFCLKLSVVERTVDSESWGF